MLAGGLLVLLAAAVKKKDKDTCTGIAVTITGGDGYSFLDKPAVMDILGITKEENPEGKMISSVNLLRLEEKLEKNVWIRDAELFFDNNRVFHIRVKERTPVARIFTRPGNSFYIDSSGKKLPLSNGMTVRLPVFTNFVAEKTTGLHKADQKLVDDIKKLSVFILSDKFWMAQISQIDIVAGNNFEMVPTIGNHIIEFGNGNNYAEKFEKLMVFYKQVLGKTGFDKYSRLDVRYDKHVVGTKRGSISKVDSIRTMKNIEQMIADAVAPAEIR
jgi:cell division protein FtsQ